MPARQGVPGTANRENSSAMIVPMLRFAGALLLVLSLPLDAAETGAITLAEGSVRLFRGPSLLTASEDVRIQPGDMLETSDRGISVVEFGDGLLLGLGPRTRLYLPESTPRSQSAEPGQPIILLAGWLKFESGKQAPADGYRILTTGLGVSTRDAKLLLHAADQRASLFLESGSGRILEPDEAGRASRGAALGAGQFASRIGAQRTAVQARPDAGFLANMPRWFRDALPARPERLKASPRAPKTDRDAAYDEVSDLLQLPKTWRGEMVRRFLVRLRDPAFRKAVAANMDHHPEWHRILYPPRPPEASRQKSRHEDSVNTERPQ